MVVIAWAREWLRDCLWSKHPEDDMVQTLYLYISTISHLNTLTRESWIGQGCVSVGLVKVEAVEVQSQEADI